LAEEQVIETAQRSIRSHVMGLLVADALYPLYSLGWETVHGSDNDPHSLRISGT
jgi:hypothetical protein